MKRERLSGNRHGKTEESILALQAEVRRLAPFEHWVRLQGTHAKFCTAPMLGDCTCGLKRLFESRAK